MLFTLHLFFHVIKIVDELFKKNSLVSNQEKNILVRDPDVISSFILTLALAVRLLQTKDNTLR